MVHIDKRVYLPAGVLARGLAVLAVRLAVLAAREGTAERTVDAGGGLVANAVDAVDGRLCRVTDCVLRTTHACGGDVVARIEAGGKNIARRAQEAADGAVDGAENARTVLAGHITAVSTAALAGRLAGVLAVRHLVLRNTAIFFTQREALHGFLG